MKKGEKMLEETKAKSSATHIRLKSGERLVKYQKSGKENPRWKGGMSKKSNYKKNWYLNTREKAAEKKRPERCEICNELGNNFKYGLHYDHDHKTGKFRGWLCGNCNLVLGLVKDNIEVLEKMVVYIKNNN